MGGWEAGQSTVADAVSERERREQFDLGVRAETCGIQLNAEGEAVHDTARRAHHRDRCRAAARRARGDRVRVRDRKADAVEAAVRGGLATSLVTHTGLATELLARA